ncbi:phosphoethanolamine transferase [Luteimonas aquatica]|uniref:phosphoethanolamine transferase n=1 Tax=Luteimonas aquatica TaxID=450364 RepID=UPI001F5AA9DF|nr:phosphoethanolamine--lipid A transferase [Luteimonas aquatica]
MNALPRQAPARQWSLPGWIALRPTLSLEVLAMLASAFFLACYNIAFWRAIVVQLDASWRLIAALVVLIWALQAFLLGLAFTRWTAKPVLTVLLLVSACAAYYMTAYNIYLDADMIRNVVHTETREAGELIVPGLLPYLLLLGVAPTLLLWRLRFARRTWTRALAVRAGFLAAMLLVGAAGAMFAFKDLSALIRNQREVRYLVTPSNYIVSLARVLATDEQQAHAPLQPIGEDAMQAPRLPGGKPRLLVFVLGETARAANWGLNGYARQTTPELAALPDLINFPRTDSCGTSTEVSVPCLFSPWGRHDYDENTIRRHQSLLHVLQRAGVDTLWRDNQTGCKGVCDGLPFESVADAKDPQLCNGKRCFDEILLQGLAARIAPDGRDRIVVLHGLGNHGPAYFQRYPQRFRRFVPTCDTDELGDCSREQIVNSYDNALLYTDHFIDQTIAFLRKQEAYDTALIYVSDHGESLGEKGLFLHGVPYAIAPQEQTHVPMAMWFSPGFARADGLDLACLRAAAAAPASHDNLFPSILGLMDVRTRLYDASLDLFRSCRRAPGAPGATATAR